MMTQDQSTWPRRRAKPCFRICNFVSINDWRDGMRAEMQDLEPNISKEERELADIAPSSDDYRQRLAALNELKNNVNGLSFATEGKARYPEAMEAEGAENVRGLDLVGEIDTGWKAFDQWASKAIGQANKNPDLLLYKLQSNGCKFAWLLVPLSIAFIWLVTLGKRSDHFYSCSVRDPFDRVYVAFVYRGHVIGTVGHRAQRRHPLGGGVCTFAYVPPVAPCVSHIAPGRSAAAQRFARVHKLCGYDVCAGADRPGNDWLNPRADQLPKKRRLMSSASRAGRSVCASRQHQLDLTSASTSSPRRMIVS